MKHSNRTSIPQEALDSLRKAAGDRSRIVGLTHRFYRYPARFSPQFVASAIHAFSRPGDVVLDPYMGGGTTIVEAMAHGRRAIGCDLNSLAVFVTTAKTTTLSKKEIKEIRNWATVVVPQTSYHAMINDLADLICPRRTRNLNIPQARPAKKLIAQCILAINTFRSDRAKTFARCVLLNVAQWALNNRKTAPSLGKVRVKIVTTTEEMLQSLDELSWKQSTTSNSPCPPVILHGSSSELHTMTPFSDRVKADLVITSPPYPGIHILYHRWQVDGGKETPAPYWIASCMDGQGASFYNFAARHEDAEEEYFRESLRTLRSIRTVTRKGALVIQLIAFSSPRRQLEKYLHGMELAGFAEVRSVDGKSGGNPLRRIWREVPQRKWYANIKGNTSSSREVVLIHRAV